MAKIASRKPVDPAKIAARKNWQLLVNLTSDLLNKARDARDTTDLDFAAVRGRYMRYQELGLPMVVTCGYTWQQTLDAAERKLNAQIAEVDKLEGALFWLQDNEPK